MINKKMLGILIPILFLVLPFYGQRLHHQMLSAQGAIAPVSNGIRISQTIGQQSVIGNYKKNNILLGQGFQQSTSAKKTSSIFKEAITTLIYPNPIKDILHFRFSSEIAGVFTVRIIDMTGKLIYNKDKKAAQNVLTLENLDFAEGNYIVELFAPNYNYTTQIVKLR